MRIFVAPFEELDDDRVLGQHHEVHALWSLIVDKGRSWGKINDEIGSWSDPKNRFSLWYVHHRIVTEMGIRQWFGHKTPIIMPEEFLDVVTPLPLDPPRELVQRDRWHLWLRWGGVFRGRETHALDEWREIAKRYEAQGGVCVHDEGVEKWEGGPRHGKNVCSLCHRVVE
jgi:hypothetical protein